MRATFITLALEDDADPHVIETRVTHTKKSRSAFDGYNRGRQWEITCAEVSKLRIVRREVHGQVIRIAAVAGSSGPDAVPVVANTGVRGPIVAQSSQPSVMMAENSGGGGSRNLPGRQRNRALAAHSRAWCPG
jgi:hypothetical protein